MQFEYGVNVVFSDPQIRQIVDNSEDSTKMVEYFLKQGEGIDVAFSYLIDIIAAETNFTPLYLVYEIDYDDAGKPSVYYFPNDGITYKKYDDTFVPYSYYLSDWKKLHTTSACIKTPDSILVATPGLPFSPYEKLILPFDGLTWILLGCTLSIGFFVIFIVNRMQTFVQHLFYGVAKNSPSLNIVRIFFGIGQTVLPDSHFGRIILILFIFFCLVFRTGYQGDLS
jgi:hypothetical protein